MEDNDVVEIDLLQILQVVKKNIILFLAICILCCTAGFAVSKFILPKKFTATAKIIIVKEGSDSLSSNSSVTYNDIQLTQKLASTYKQILMSEAISDEVIDELDLYNLYEIDNEEYGKIVKVEAADSTEVMNISVETKDPQLSANIANKIVSVFISKIYDIMEVQNVSILNNAKVPTKKSAPSVMVYTAVGGVVGVVICALIAVIQTLTDTKVKTEEEVKQIFTDYPIIGTIPNFLNKEVIYDDESN